MLEENIQAIKTDKSPTAQRWWNVMSPAHCTSTQPSVFSFRTLQEFRNYIFTIGEDKKKGCRVSEDAACCRVFFQQKNSVCFCPWLHWGRWRVSRCAQAAVRCAANATSGGRCCVWKVGLRVKWSLRLTRKSAERQKAKKRQKKKAKKQKTKSPHHGWAENKNGD